MLRPLTSYILLNLLLNCLRYWKMVNQIKVSCTAIYTKAGQTAQKEKLLSGTTESVYMRADVWSVLQSACHCLKSREGGEILNAKSKKLKMLAECGGLTLHLQRAFLPEARTSRQNLLLLAQHIQASEQAAAANARSCSCSHVQMSIDGD